MPRSCTVPGCAEVASGYSTLCRLHKQAQRRHGSPTQRGVTSHELKPYVALVEARKSKNPSSDVWAILEARWGAVVDASRGTLHSYAQGEVSIRASVQAAHHIVTVAENVEPWAVIRTVLAMYVLMDQQPGRFPTDAGFDVQAVRRVLRLAPVNAGTYWDQAEHRSKRVYRDVPPRVVQALAVPLKQAVGGAGLMLAAKERDDAQRVTDEKQRLAKAVEELQ